MRPPQALAPAIPRPRLETFLDESLTRRVTSVVAGAGFGKSTLLAVWASGSGAAWYTVDQSDRSLLKLARGIDGALRVRVNGLPPDLLPTPGSEAHEAARAEQLAGRICAALEDCLEGDLALVLDDVHEIGRRSPSVRLIEALCRQTPRRLHIVLASRTDLPFSVERLRGRGETLELDAAALAFSEDEIRALQAGSLDESPAGLASRILAVSGGWPAAVRLAVEALRPLSGDRREELLGRLAAPDGPLFSYLAEEVFGREKPATRELLGRMALFDRFTVDLCELLGVDNAEQALADLLRRGLCLQAPHGTRGWLSLHSLAREFALQRWPPQEGVERALRQEAAAWLEREDEVEEALRHLIAARAWNHVAEVVRREGYKLLKFGAVETVKRATELLPAEKRDSALDELLGAAYMWSSDRERARACFERAAENAESLRPMLAFWLAMLEFPEGDLAAALRFFARARLSGEGTAEEATLLSYWALTHVFRGELEEAKPLASRALRAATAAHDASALADAHNALAILATAAGEPSVAEAHYRQALEFAENPPNPLQVLRTCTNLAGLLNEQGQHAEALVKLELALEAGEGAVGPVPLARCLSIRGETRFLLGRFEEALADYEAARAEYVAAGRLPAISILIGVAEIHRERGDLALARAAYEEALSRAERAEHAQHLRLALAGLARVLAANEPDRAALLAARAVDLGAGGSHERALIAAGWVGLVRGERAEAARLASEAAEVAGRVGNRAGLAESLELRVFAAAQPARETESLEEAARLWREVRSPVGAARVELAQARLAKDRARMERAERGLRDLGLRPGAAARGAGLLAALGVERTAPITVHSLGGFTLVRAGQSVPLPEWKSKRARDLLKMLIARRGRPTAREVLMEALWPEENPAPLANRLSVLLSTVRAVFDPQRRFEPDHFVSADRNAVGLDLAHVDVDVERFLSHADAGLTLYRKGRLDEAASVLELAESAYTGDFLEEDLYEDWAAPLREEARAAYVAVARALAEIVASAGDHETALRHLLRILERDRYDERAHLELVSVLSSAGKHGEARRAYRAYAARMEEIAVEPAPFST